MPGSAVRLLSRAAAAAGLTLTLAGTMLPAAAPSAAVAHGTTGSLRHLLNPDGAETSPDPAEAMTGQQAFAAAHFGKSALAHPFAMSAALSRGVREAALVPQNLSLSGSWKLRGPSRYYANDRARSGSLVDLGMENLSGRVTTIATTPQRPDQIWVGAADGGVWKSSDAGAHWKPMFDHQGTLAIGSIAVDPTDADRVYVGTGEANTNADAYYGLGMYVTNDGGRHWHNVRLPGVLTVFHVEVAKPSKGFPDGRVFAATNHGLWLSTDHGRHYVNVDLPTNTNHNGVYTATPFGNFVTDVRVRPHHVNEVVAVVGWRGGSATMPNGKKQSVGNGF
jgi:hypothetical protein